MTVRQNATTHSLVGRSTAVAHFFQPNLGSDESGADVEITAFPDGAIHNRAEGLQQTVTGTFKIVHKGSTIDGAFSSPVCDVNYCI